MNLIKRAGSPYWYARIFRNGKEVWMSTKEKRKSQALEAAAQLVDQHDGTTDLTQTFERVINGLTHTEPETAAKLRRQFIHQLMEGSTEKLAIADAFTAWMESGKRKKGAKDQTLAGYKSYWGRFAKWITAQKVSTGDEPVTYLHEVTESMADAYTADLRNAGLSGATFNKHVSFLKGLFRTVAAKAGLEANVWREMAKEANRSASRRALTQQEISTVLQKADPEMRAWLLVGLYTGMRLVDVISLQWDSIDFKNAICTVTPRKTERNQKTISIPLHPALLPELKKLRRIARGNAYVFPDAHKAYEHDRSAISKRIQQHFADCEIVTTEAPHDARTKRRVVKVGFHSLRHSFVSMVAAGNVPEVVIRDLVGHGSPAMTRLYAHASDKQKTSAIAGLPAVGFKQKKLKAKNSSPKGASKARKRSRKPKKM